MQDLILVSVKELVDTLKSEFNEADRDHEKEIEKNFPSF